MLTNEEKDLFDVIISGQYSNLVLFRVGFYGQPTAAICCVNEDDQDYHLTPLAVLVRPEDEPHLVDNEGAPLAYANPHSSLRPAT